MTTILRRLRYRTPLTQAQLGAAIGLTQAGLSRIEGGHTVTTTAVLARMADALGVQITDLAAGIGPDGRFVRLESGILPQTQLVSQ